MAHTPDHTDAMSQDEFLSSLESTFTQGLAGGLPSEGAGIIGGHWGGGEPWRGVPYVMPEQVGNLPEPYYEGDDFAILESMNTEQLARFQDTLVATGLVREVVPGRIDDSTIKGMGTLMALGNRQSETWQNVLDGIQRAGGLDGDASGRMRDFDPKPYVAPDYATLAQEVKATFRQRLGRDPDQAEMAQLTAELSGWHKGSYNEQVSAERQQFENAQADGEQAAGTFTDVDPVARFREMFERRYANELDFVEDKETAVETREQVEQTTNTLSAMSTGGR